MRWRNKSSRILHTLKVFFKHSYASSKHPSPQIHDRDMQRMPNEFIDRACKNLSCVSRAVSQEGHIKRSEFFKLNLFFLSLLRTAAHSTAFQQKRSHFNRDTEFKTAAQDPSKKLSLSRKTKQTNMQNATDLHQNPSKHSSQSKKMSNSDQDCSHSTPSTIQSSQALVPEGEVKDTPNKTFRMEFDISWIKIFGSIWKWIRNLGGVFVSAFTRKKSVDQPMNIEQSPPVSSSPHQLIPPPTHLATTESRMNEVANSDSATYFTEIVAPVKIDPISWIPVVGPVWKCIRRFAKFLSSIKEREGKCKSATMRSLPTQSSGNPVDSSNPEPKVTKSDGKFKIDPISWIPIIGPIWKWIRKFADFLSKITISQKKCKPDTATELSEIQVDTPHATSKAVKLIIPITIDLEWKETFESAWKNIRRMAASLVNRNSSQSKPEFSVPISIDLDWTRTFRSAWSNIQCLAASLFATNCGLKNEHKKIL